MEMCIIMIVAKNTERSVIFLRRGKYDMDVLHACMLMQVISLYTECSFRVGWSRRWHNNNNTQANGKRKTERHLRNKVSSQKINKCKFSGRKRGRKKQNQLKKRTTPYLYLIYLGTFAQKLYKCMHRQVGRQVGSYTKLNV